jgi:alanyl-tRNA synthetase
LFLPDLCYIHNHSRRIAQVRRILFSAQVAAMNHLEIRQAFINYFLDKSHTLVAPSPIIPQDDPTLLFTNAGMNQFKDVLLGKEKRSYSRAISIQPCMRVGGKHNDLDEVGRDGRHLTWFEMLGNWSFGDYGKEEAILWAYELVTRRLGLDLSRVYASVYKNDDESYGYWKKLGFPDSRIVRLGDIEQGDEENFWSMGPTGPCGRCTELYFDQGAERFGHDVVGGPTDRFLEFWNLVFMEFDRNEAGEFKPLPLLSVDTGMGMERIAAMLEGKTNVFETSLFQPVIDFISESAGRAATGEDLVSMRVLADHSRALSFVLHENGQFDRQGRGYVLRRILRRAVLHGKKLGFTEPFLWQLVAPQIQNLPVYNVTAEQQSRVADAIRKEEEKFFETLDRGLAFFARARAESKGGVIAGDAAFQLHDTYGFPIDLTGILAEEHGLSVDMAGFERALEEQRQRSQQAAHFYDKGGWVHVADGVPQAVPTHGLTGMDCRLLEYRPTDGDAVDLKLDRSPFYVSGGGELADHGTLSANGLTLWVTDVQKTDSGIIHSAVLRTGSIEDLAKINTFSAEVDAARRDGKAAHHTGTHLLHAALREILGDRVRQMGSLVDHDRLRFDISFDRALNETERQEVERLVNQWIFAAHPVQHLADLSMDAAREMGALAFFGEKYGEKVRVIHIHGVSTELCGGNHVSNTGQIGALAILSDEALGAGVRRIEAVCHFAAVSRFADARAQLGALARQLATPVAQLGARIEKLQNDVREAQAAARKALKAVRVQVTPEDLLAKAETRGGRPVVIADVGDLPEDALMGLIDPLRDRAPDGVFVLVKIEDGKGTLLVGAGDAAVAAGAHAGNLAREIGKRLGSGGGGKPTFARAGFRDADFAAVQAATREVLPIAG